MGHAGIELLVVSHLPYFNVVAALRMLLRVKDALFFYRLYGICYMSRVVRATMWKHLAALLCCTDY